jgi:hypothetical protein
VVETGFRLRDALASEGLDCWPKTTGGKGLHVMVPIEPAMAWRWHTLIPVTLPSGSHARRPIGMSRLQRPPVPVSCSSTTCATVAARPQSGHTHRALGRDFR